jgi:hypothetical protein
LAAFLTLTACAQLSHPTVKTGGAGTSLSILHATTHRTDGWHHVPLRGKTDYSVVEREGRAAIMAVGRHTASGLARRVDINPKTCRHIRWSWRIDQMQTDIDLRNKSKEDVAASLFLTFGDPGFMIAPNPVPTVRYVWTTDHMKIGEIFDNPFRPDIIRTIVVENRTDRLGEWVDFTRDLYADFATAFGKPPKDHLKLVSIFTDNDQSKEPVKAYYGPITMRCSG